MSTLDNALQGSIGHATGTQKNEDNRDKDLTERLLGLLQQSTPQSDLDAIPKRRGSYYAAYLKIKEKNMRAKEWLVNGEMHNGAHFPVVAFTANSSHRSEKKAKERAAKRCAKLGIHKGKGKVTESSSSIDSQGSTPRAAKGKGRGGKSEIEVGKNGKGRGGKSAVAAPHSEDDDEREAGKSHAGSTSGKGRKGLQQWQHENNALNLDSPNQRWPQQQQRPHGWICHKGYSSNNWHGKNWKGSDWNGDNWNSYGWNRGWQEDGWQSQWGPDWDGWM